MVQNPNVMVRNLIEKEGVVFNENTASAQQQQWQYEGNFQYLDLHFNKIANGGNFIFRDSSNDYANNNPTGNIKIIDKDTGAELSTTITIGNSCPSNIRIDARNVKGVRVYLTAGVAGQLSVTKINGNETENIGNVKTTVENMHASIEKEGEVFNGTASSQQNFTYEGEYQYLDVDFTPNARTGGLAFRDKGDNYASNNYTQIKVMDKDTGAYYAPGPIPMLATRTYHLRVDARHTLGVMVILFNGSDCKVNISKVFTNDSRSGEELKFTSLLSGLSASTNLIHADGEGHKPYMIAKITTNSSEVVLNVFDGASTSSPNNTPSVYYPNGVYRTGVNSINIPVSGTHYVFVDVSNLSRVNFYVASGSAVKIDDMSIFFTDDISLAKRIVGIGEDFRLMDIFENQNYNQFTFLPKLNHKRWYVLYLDFISGTINKNTTMALSTLNAPIIRFDGYQTSTLQGFNFKTAGALKSGYYCVDLKDVNIDSVAYNARVAINSTNTSDLLVRIVHVGQFDEISQFVKIEDKFLNISDDKFQLKSLGHTMHYALDDYWVEFGNVTTLCKDDKLYSIDLSTLGWRIHQFTHRESAKLLHPSMDNVNGYESMRSIKTMLMLAVEDSSQASDNHAFEWWVCDVTNPYDAVTKSNWSKCKFWEKRGTKRKIPTKESSAVDANHRYDTTLPDSFYNYDEVSANGYHIAYQGEADIFMLRGFGAHGKKLTIFGQYTGTGDRVCLWATTDGGFNFVCVYDFVGLSANADESINTSAFSNYSSGLTLSKVTRNIPTAAVKEPEHKYTITELSGWSITKGANTVINFNAAHGFNNFEIVAFTGNAGAEWNQLTTSELNADSIGDNAYMCIINSATQVTLKPYRGSYDDNLQCRHIHSVNETKSGFVFATGEDYPQGWMMFLEQKKKDGGEVLDAMTENFKVYRLNSGENSLQRACGVLMFENEADPTIIFNSDDSNVVTNMQWAIDGRTNLPMSSSNGIWKGKLSDIDDYSKFECIADIPEPAIWMFRYNGIIVGYYQLGGIVVSVDDGKSFRYYPYYDGVRLLVGTYKGKIVMNQGYALELK